MYPLVLAKFSAESPLARHSRMRSTHFASVSFVMRPSLPTNRTPRKNASLCSGYNVDGVLGVVLHDRALDLSAALRHYRRALKDATTLGDDDFPF